MVKNNTLVKMVNSVKIKSSFYCHERVADFPKVANDFLMNLAMVQLESDFPTTVVKEFSLWIKRQIKLMKLKCLMTTVKNMTSDCNIVIENRILLVTE